MGYLFAFFWYFMNNEILFDKLKPVYPMDTRKKI